jgi:hypothetical protein
LRMVSLVILESRSLPALRLAPGFVRRAASFHLCRALGEQR